MATAVLAGLVVYSLCAGTCPPPLPALLGCGAGALLLLFHHHEHDGVLTTDVLARRSRLSEWPPVWKTVCCGLMLLLCVAATTAWIPLALCAVLWGLTVLAGRLPLGRCLRLFSVPAAFLLLSGLALLWEYSAAAEGVLSVPLGGGWLVLTAAAQARAKLVMARALGAVSCLYFLSLSTPMPELLGALRRLRVPAVMTELAVLIYRYVFLLLSIYQDQKNAAASRLGYDGLHRSLRTTGAIYGNLLAASFRRAEACFAAMESRCWEGELRFLEQPKRAAPGAALLLGGLTAALAAAVAWQRVRGG